jgi:hypothetical protein
VDWKFFEPFAFQFPAPVAGADPTTNLPEGWHYFVLGFSSSLVADAAVANRFPGVNFNLGPVALGFRVATIAQTAATTRFYDFGLGNSAEIDDAVNGTRQLPLPLVPLIAPALVVISTFGLQALDQWGLSTLSGYRVPMLR